jgi:hypothetical protein
MDDEIDRLIASLTTAPSVEQKLEVLARLITYWHGPGEPELRPADDRLQARRLPRPLRWWYERGARRSGVYGGQNRLLGPDDLVDLDGHLLFYVENQGVYLWATEGEGADPPVWGRFDGDEPWVREEVSLSGFLVQACLFEAIFSAPFGASVAWAGQETLDRVTAPLHPVPLGAWRWPAYPSRFWAGGGAFVFAGPNGPPDGDPAYSIWAGAKSERPLAYLKAVADESWELTPF